MTLNDIYHAIDPVALSLGPLQIRWYGLAYVAASFAPFSLLPNSPSAGRFALTTTLFSRWSSA